MYRGFKLFCFFLALSLSFAFGVIGAEEPPVKVDVHWDKVVRVSKTIPTILYIATPKTQRGAPLHDVLLNSVKDLGADDVRYAPCNFFPRSVGRRTRAAREDIHLLGFLAD